MEIIAHKKLNNKWLRAAVIGSLWASFEIIAGSFLHNLRVPFSGTILSFISVSLLVLFLHRWNERGIIWRAGLICALMKSISPSAVILGPMVGIISEAIIIELLTILLGRNILGYMVGGALAVTSTIFQKVVGLLILYGTDLIRIVEGLYLYFVKITKLDQFSPTVLISAVFIIYILAGCIAAWLGYTAARKYLKDSANNSSSEVELEKLHLKPLWDIDKGKSYSTVWIFLTALFIGFSLYFLQKDMFIPALSIGIPFTIFCLIRYNQELGKLKKINVWLQFILIILLAAVLWDWAATGKFFSSGGIIAGLKMCFRAILIILGFSVVSIELRNPLVKSLLLDHGFNNLYAALNLSFAAMPGIIERMPKPAELFKKRGSLINEILNQSEILLSIFNSEPQRTPVFIISGDVHEGKTTFVKKLTEALNAKGHSTSGFLAPGTFLNGERNHFDLLDISTNERIRLSDINPEDGWILFRKYGFNPEAIERGNQILHRSENRDDIIIVDEVGPFEITGKGWSEGLLSILRNDVISIWVVRKRLLKQVMAKWSGRTFYVADIAEDKVEEVIENIEKVLFDRGHDAR